MSETYGIPPMGTKIWRLLFMAGVLAYFLISRSRADNPPVVIDTAQLTGQPLTNALVTYQPLSYLAASNRLWTLVPWTNRTDAYGVTIIPAVIPGDYRLTIDDRRITTILTNRVQDTNATLYAANLIFGPAPVPITDLRYFSMIGSNLVEYTNNGRKYLAATGSGSGGGGAATNAISSAYTNNVLAGNGLTQIGLTNGSNITVAATVAGGRVTYTIHAPGMASLVQVTNIAVIWATLSSNLSYALGANATNYADGLAVAASNLSYQIGAAGSNLSYAVGLNGTNYTDSRAVALSNLSYVIGTAATNYTDSRAVALSNLCATILGLVGETNWLGNAGVTNSTRFGLAWGKAGNTNLVKTLTASGAIVFTDQGTNLDIGASAASGEANVNGEAGLTNATRVGMVAGKAGITNLLRSVSAGLYLVVTNEGTNVVFAVDWSTLTNGIVTILSNGVPVLTATLWNVGSINLTNALGVASGGTGLTNLGTNTIFVGNGTNPPTLLPPGTTGQVLKMGASAPAWGTDNDTGGGGSGAFLSLISTQAVRKLPATYVADATTNTTFNVQATDNPVLIMPTNTHLIFSNVPPGISGKMEVRMDTNGGRSLVSMRVSGGLLITNGALYLDTNANAMTVFDYHSSDGTNIVIRQLTTEAELVDGTNQIAATVAPKQIGSASLTNLSGNVNVATNIVSGGGPLTVASNNAGTWTVTSTAQPTNANLTTLGASRAITVGTSNAFLGGLVYFSSDSFTNLNATATASNLAAVTIGGNTLTNNGDGLVAEWSGQFKNTATGTNQFQIIYGSETILDTGLLPASNAVWNAWARIVRTGNTSLRAIARLEWGTHTNTCAYVFTNANVTLSQTQGIATVLKMMGAARSLGGHTNTDFRCEVRKAGSL